MAAEERRGALPHPAQLAAYLLRRAVGDTTQRLVQSGKSCPALVPGVTHSLTLSAVPDENKAWLCRRLTSHTVFLFVLNKGKLRRGNKADGSREKVKVDNSADDNLESS